MRRRGVDLERVWLIVSILGANVAAVGALGVMVPSLVWQGQLWRLLSWTFFELSPTTLADYDSDDSWSASDERYMLRMKSNTSFVYVTHIMREVMEYMDEVIVLRDGNGNIVGTAVTDGSGDYSFTGLPDGSYTVDVTDTANVLNGLWKSNGPAPGEIHRSGGSGVSAERSLAGLRTRTA